MTVRTVALTLAAALTVGCGGARREQARQDSIRAVFVADSVRFAAAADSIRRADSIAAAAATATKAKAPARSKTTRDAHKGDLGRDSVRVGTKIIRMPIVSDTAKRRPPT